MVVGLAEAVASPLVPEAATELLGEAAGVPALVERAGLEESLPPPQAVRQRAAIRMMGRVREVMADTVRMSKSLWPASWFPDHITDA